MVEPPDQTSFYASRLSGRTWASVVAGRGGEDGGDLSSVMGFDSSSQSLTGKSESYVVGSSFSDSDQSSSPTTDCVAEDSVSPGSATSSEVVSYETAEDKEIEEDGVGEFENVSIDVQEKVAVDTNLVLSDEFEKEKIADKEGETYFDSLETVVDGLESEDGIKEELSLVSGKVDDEDKRDHSIEEEIVNLNSTKSVLVSIEEPNDLIAAFDGDFESVAKEDAKSEVAKIEPMEKEEFPVSGSSTVDAKEDSKSLSNKVKEVSEVNNADEGGNKITVADIMRVDGSGIDEETEERIFGSSVAREQFLERLEKTSFGIDDDHSGETNIPSYQVERIDGQIVTDSDEEVDTNDEGEENTFDTAALAAFLKGTSDGGNSNITSQDGTEFFLMEPPAGLGSSVRLVRSAAPRPNCTNIFPSLKAAMGGESESNLSEEEKHKLEKLQNVRVKYLRLVHRLGISVEDSIAEQVLYKLALLAGRYSGQSFSLAAKKMAMESEAEGKEDLNFSLNILVLGKSGVGKSATINSILGDQNASIDAFGPSTTSVREISKTVGGIKITIIDTPGLKSSAMDQSANSKMLSSVKKVMKRFPPDIVLYVDRLDTQDRGLNNLPLLRTITASLGSSIWKNAIVTLTHAASAPPDGPSGTPLNYEEFVSQCSYIVQQSIGKAVGLTYSIAMTPVYLVENHPLCRKNQAGEKVLPNGQVWKPALMLLCYSLKVLSEAISLMKPQEPLNHRNIFGSRVRSRPLSSMLSLPNLLSWLLPSRAHPKLPADQGGDSVDSDIEINDVSDSEQDDGEDDEYDQYDQLPSFKPLRKSQLAKLSKEQRNAYFEEYDYRVKLLQKKQWREGLKRMRETKKNGKKLGESEYVYPGQEEDPENGAPAPLPVPLPDMVLPPSFDSDNSAYRYRSLEPTSQFLTTSMLKTKGWDHDCGYDCVIAEQSLAIAKRFPTAVTVQMTKDKKNFDIHLDSSVCAKHGGNGSTMAGLTVQNVSNQLMYLVVGETKFKNLMKNKTSLGGSVTFFGGDIATCFKLHDQIAVGKRIVLVGNVGTMQSQEESAYEANLEVRLREADFPIGQNQSVLGLSLTKSKEDLTLAGNIRSQVSIGRQTNVAASASLDTKRSGHVTVRISSSDQLQMAVMAILPLAMSIYKRVTQSGGEN